ncbi:NADPH-dependent F420 reductase [Agrobacterium sp. CG674]
MSTVAIIGSGKIGSALATRFFAAGLNAMITNSRGPESLADLTAKFGSLIEAVKVGDALLADIGILAMHFDAVQKAVGGVADCEGRIVVDATNAINFPEFTTLDLGDRLSTQVIAEMAPGARVVKAFNTLQAHVLTADPDAGIGRRVLFLSGDYADGNRTIGELIYQVVFFPIDLGVLTTGALMQQFSGPLAKMNLLKD